MTREREQACQRACACAWVCGVRNVLRGEERARSGVQAQSKREEGVRGLGGGYRGRGFLRAPRREVRVRKGGAEALQPLGDIFPLSPSLVPPLIRRVSPLEGRLLGRPR